MNAWVSTVSKTILILKRNIKSRYSSFIVALGIRTTPLIFERQLTASSMNKNYEYRD